MEDQGTLYADFMRNKNKGKQHKNHDGQNKPYQRKINKNLRITQDFVNMPVNSDKYENIKLPDKGRPYSVGIAVPASILEDTCLREDLRIYVVGQLAKSAAIFGVDEFVVYNDHCWKKCANNDKQQSELMELMTTVLQYQECPQYLRKKLCPMSPYLANAGAMNPIAAPHHLKGTQWCSYREGVVVGMNGKAGALVDVGIGRNVLVTDKNVTEGTRVTVKLLPAARVMKSPTGVLVSPHEPRLKHGVAWGFSVRVADSLAEVFTGCEHSEGYDFLIGTSDRGTMLDDLEEKKFERALVVFGGVDGLEESLSREKGIQATSPKHLFDAYLNACPQQQTRTIRTEEAVPLTLAALTAKFNTWNH